MTARVTDPIERLIADALDDAGIQYVCNDRDLDFYLPDLRTHIEVKQFHSDRISAQMARSDNVIVVQGRWAASVLASWISRQSVRQEVP